jgi:hypothetical protein
MPSESKYNERKTTIKGILGGFRIGRHIPALNRKKEVVTLIEPIEIEAMMYDITLYERGRRRVHALLSQAVKID